MELNPLRQSDIGQKLEGSVYNPRKLELETKATRSPQPFRDRIAPSTLTTWTYTLPPRPTAFVLKIISPGQTLAHFPKARAQPQASNGQSSQHWQVTSNFWRFGVTSRGATGLNSIYLGAAPGMQSSALWGPSPADLPSRACDHQLCPWNLTP